MSIEMKSELTANEIIFMQRMESELLPNRQHVSIPTMSSVGSLVGIMINGTCRSCVQAGGVDLLNRYGQLKPKYDEYVKNKPVEPVYTKYEAVIQDEVDGFSIDEPTPIFDADGNIEKKKKPIK